MKKILFVIFLSFIFFLFFIFSKENNSSGLLNDRIVVTESGDRILKGYKEYTDIDADLGIFDGRNEYLKISEDKEIFLKREKENFYFVEYNKNTKVEKKIIISEEAKKFQFNDEDLYYVKKNLSKDRDELHKLNTNKNIDTVLVNLEQIDYYIAGEDSIILVDMGIFHKYNIKTGETDIIDAHGKIFDYVGDELFLYKENPDNEICFYKQNINFAIKEKCDLKVSFAKRKEVLAEKPIKLEDGIYVLKFAKIREMPVRYEVYEIFGITVFRRPVETFPLWTDYFFKVIDLKNKKNIAQKIKLDK